MVDKEGFDGFTKFNLWGQLLGVVEHNEEALEGELDSVLERLDPAGKSQVRSAVSDITGAIERLFDVSERLLREGFDPALAKVQWAFDTLSRHFSLLIECVDWMEKTGRTPTDLITAAEDSAQAKLLVELLRARFQCELARLVVDEVPDAACRATFLLTLAAKARPGPLAQEYLGRVARCFIWGYETETLILCGSVLEQVLEDTVSYEDVFTAFEKKQASFPYELWSDLKERRPPTPVHRIHAAQALDRFTTQQADMANRIRLWRNKALHDGPALKVSAHQAVAGLTDLLGSLCPIG
jgi:hypothetical protein